MTNSRRPEGTDISALFGVLRRRGLIILAAVVVAAGVAYAYSKQQDPKYSASVKLLLRGPVNPAPGTNFGTPNPATAPDRESLVLSGAVKKRVVAKLSRRLGSRASAAAAFERASALSGSESSVVKITATDSNAANAALIANTIAGQNIANRRQASLAKIRRAQKVARRELRALGPAGTNPQKLGTVNQLQQQLQTLNQAAGTQDGDADVIAPAAVPKSPTSPKPSRDALIGGFAGLLLGFALALVREQLDRRLKHVGELQDSFDLPVLANVPSSRALSSRNGKALDALPAAEREAFQMLRANLHFLNTDRELNSVVVTSASVGDGKSTVAVNLAKADAAVGGKVLLIESDMRRPSIAALLGIDVVDGLVAYLSRPDTRLEDAVRRVPVGEAVNGASAALTMDVLVAGTVPGNPSELINSQRMRDLIAEAEQKYNLVVIDTSPAGIVADAIPLMSEASAVVVVGRVGKLTTGEAHSLREQLERIDAPAFGLVANFTGAGDKSYGYY